MLYPLCESSPAEKGSTRTSSRAGTDSDRREDSYDRLRVRRNTVPRKISCFFLPCKLRTDFAAAAAAASVGLSCPIFSSSLSFSLYPLYLVSPPTTLFCCCFCPLLVVASSNGVIFEQEVVLKPKRTVMCLFPDGGVDATEVVDAADNEEVCYVDGGGSRKRRQNSGVPALQHEDFPPILFSAGRRRRKRRMDEGAGGRLTYWRLDWFVSWKAIILGSPSPHLRRYLCVNALVCEYISVVEKKRIPRARNVIDYQGF